MAQTGTTLQTRLAYRLGETAAPSDTTVKTQRYSWLTDAYYQMASDKNWWWLEAEHTSNTNTGSTTGYSEPTDLKEFIELKISDVFYEQIPYKSNQIYRNTIGVVTLPTLRRHYKFYRYAGKYYLIPEDGDDEAVHYIKYYKRVTAIGADADTLLIPDEYSEALVAYAEARYWMSITQQAKAVVPFQEFDQILLRMTKEQSRRGMGSAGFVVREPEDVTT